MFGIEISDFIGDGPFERRMSLPRAAAQGKYCVDNYFADMKSVFSYCYRIAKKGAIMWLIVSTSAYAGIEIPVDLMLADMVQIPPLRQRVPQGLILSGFSGLLHSKSNCLTRGFILRNGRSQRNVTLSATFL
jgi:hypothetical protein